ncbi:hypothetical protein D9615_009252 [Tricholomella constricta]|uniref:F-box domain-containing protein n=1 Tax=Tricholomella constricta TaxID=117010 RepID=A0A8H5LWV3_9AGAR|nr:hypothetical protein D9615_009252 [Tricholomella constricta]
MAQPPICSLPLELLEEIADVVDPNTQLALCLVSKLFHSLTLASLYRVIYLDTPSSVVACCRTLAQNKKAAMAVRNFSIYYTPFAPPGIHYFTSFYSNVRAALMQLPHLQELKLMVFDPTYIQVLNHAFFPSLRHFECQLALTDSLILFLNRHPMIIYLQIAPNEALRPLSIGSILPQVVLPKLQYFIGNSECVSALVPDASLRAAFIFWEANDGTPQDAIRSLERSSGDTINLVSCRRRGWNLDLLDLISIWLPNIYVLIITNLLVVDSRPSEAYLTTVRGLLSRFSMLRHLHLYCVDTWKMSNLSCNLDEDFATVMEWGAACPSLVECILPHSNNMKWIRLHDLWIPDPTNPQGAEWTLKMLYSNTHPRWNQLLVDITNHLRKKSGYTQRFEDIFIALRCLTLNDDEDGIVVDNTENVVQQEEDRRLTDV